MLRTALRTEMTTRDGSILLIDRPRSFVILDEIYMFTQPYDIWYSIVNMFDLTTHCYDTAWK